MASPTSKPVPAPTVHLGHLLESLGGLAGAAQAINDAAAKKAIAHFAAAKTVAPSSPKATST